MLLGPWRRVIEAVTAIKFGLVFFLPLHATVLEPDFDLTFGEAQRMSNFDPSPSSEVTIEMELFFQLQSLVTGVSLPASFPFCNIKMSIDYNLSQNIYIGM